VLCSDRIFKPQSYLEEIIYLVDEQVYFALFGGIRNIVNGARLLLRTPEREHQCSVITQFFKTLCSVIDVVKRQLLACEQGLINANTLL
jgi:hypothetical protein